MGYNFERCRMASAQEAQDILKLQRRKESGKVEERKGQLCAPSESGKFGIAIFSTLAAAVPEVIVEGSFYFVNIAGFRPVVGRRSTLPQFYNSQRSA